MTNKEVEELFNEMMFGNLRHHEPVAVEIEKVMFKDPATIVFWSDNTKTIVKCEGEKYDKEKGLAMAIVKKCLGNTGRYYDLFKQFIKEEE